MDELFYRIPAILIALTVHEYAHGRVAYELGDATAKMQGRLTLNPIHHLDPIGTLMLFFFYFGWAKPVPVNPVNFRRDIPMKKSMLYVAIAGPASNIITAFIFIGLNEFLRVMALSNPAIYDSFGFLFPVLSLIITINVYLAIFNMLPIPPLDGSKVLRGVLPTEYENAVDFLNQYGFLILIALLFTGVLGNVLIPIANVILEILHLPFNLIL